MKKLRRILSMFVASVALMSTISSYGTLTSSAASARKTVEISGLNGEKFHLEYMDCGYNSVKITGCGRYDKHIIIPAKLDGKNVVSIEENAFVNAVNSLEAVVVGPNVTSVGKKGFGVNKWGLNTYLSGGISVDNRNIKLDGYYNGRFPTGKLYLNNGKGDTFYQGCFQPYIKFKRGDMNGDGSVDSVDAQLILNYAVKSLSRNAVWDIDKIARADVNRNGDVDVEDAQLTLDYYVSTLSGNSKSFEQVLCSKGL